MAQLRGHLGLELDPEARLHDIEACVQLGDSADAAGQVAAVQVHGAQARGKPTAASIIGLAQDATGWPRQVSRPTVPKRQRCVQAAALARGPTPLKSNHAPRPTPPPR